MLGAGLLLAALSTGPTWADASVRFENIGTRDGLSQGHVSAITQDRQGFIWIGTLDGLHRYDGHELVVFKHDPRDRGSLSDNVIHDLAVGPHGEVWVATQAGGLNRFNPGLGSFDRFDWGDGSASGLPSRQCDDLAFDADGTLWVSSGDGGICGLRRGAERFECLEDQHGVPLGTGAAGELLVTTDGQLWVALQNLGLARLDPSSGVLLDDGWVPGSERGNVTLMQDRSGTIWSGSYGHGVHRYIDGRMEPVPSLQELGPSAQIVTSLLQSRDGDIWIGTVSEGVFLLDPTSGEVEQVQHDPHKLSSIAGNSISSLHQDASGTVWVGTSGRGISRYSPYRFKFDLHRIEGEGNTGFVYAVIEGSDGTLWSGGGAPGLVEHHDGTDILHAVEIDGRPVVGPFIMALHELEDGRLLLGTERGGLMAFDRGEGSFSVLWESDAVHAIAGAEGGVWFGTVRSGLHFLELATGATRRWDQDNSPLPKDLIGALLVDHAGAVWIGTSRSGLFRFDPTSESFQHYAAGPGGLAHDGVLSIHEDEERRLWLGTRGGLTRLDPSTGETVSFLEGSSLPNGVIYGILPDDEGYLWLSTNKGLTRFDPRGGPPRQYTERDGLQDDEFNRGAWHRSGSGELYFGGVNGISYFRPDELRDNPTPPRLALTSFRLFNGASQPVPAEGLRLSYREHAFAVEFSALDYAAPERCLYSYLLEGYDPAWSSPSSWRSASWTRVPPGSYTLRIRASNNDGVWTTPEQEIALPVTIVPPPWRRFPVQAASVLLMLGLLGASSLLYTRSLRRQRDRLLAEVQQRTQELQELARTDSLTGLANRRYLVEVLHAEVQRASRQGTDLCLLLMDLDSFKRINDDLGHPTGDRALRDLAQACSAACRPFDTLGRIGGDEFVLLLPNTGESGAMGVAERIRGLLRSPSLAVPLTVSIGAVKLLDGETPEELLQRADQALLQAKQRGKDQAVFGR